MTVFNIAQFVEMAIKDEEVGEVFYRTVAENTKNQELKSAFIRIAEQEKQHAVNFRAMLSEVSEVSDDSKREEYSGQYESFLNTLLENRAFPNAEKTAKYAQDIKDDEKALHVALGLEKDTLLLYYEILKLIPTGHKDKVEKIMDEERGHIGDLTALQNI